jgi:hypothetical protein
MISDYFTKPLQGTLFQKKMRYYIMNVAYDSSDPVGSPPQDHRSVLEIEVPVLLPVVAPVEKAVDSDGFTLVTRKQKNGKNVSCTSTSADTERASKPVCFTGKLRTGVELKSKSGMSEPQNG